MIYIYIYIISIEQENRELSNLKPSVRILVSCASIGSSKHRRITPELEQKPLIFFCKIDVDS